MDLREILDLADRKENVDLREIVENVDPKEILDLVGLKENVDLVDLKEIVVFKVFQVLQVFVNLHLELKDVQDLPALVVLLDLQVV